MKPRLAPETAGTQLTLATHLPALSGDLHGILVSAYAFDALYCEGFSLDSREIMRKQKPSLKSPCGPITVRTRSVSWSEN